MKTLIWRVLLDLDRNFIDMSKFSICESHWSYDTGMSNMIWSKTYESSLWWLSWNQPTLEDLWRRHHVPKLWYGLFLRDQFQFQSSNLRILTKCCQQLKKTIDLPKLSMEDKYEVVEYNCLYKNQFYRVNS